MTEFNDIFAYALPTAVYVYCTIGFIAAYGLVGLWMFRQPQRLPRGWAVYRA